MSGAARCTGCQREVPPEPGPSPRATLAGHMLPCAHVREDGSECAVGMCPRVQPPLVGWLEWLDLPEHDDSGDCRCDDCVLSNALMGPLPEGARWVPVDP